MGHYVFLPSFLSSFSFLNFSLPMKTLYVFLLSTLFAFCINSCNVPSSPSGGDEDVVTDSTGIEDDSTEALTDTVRVSGDSDSFLLMVDTFAIVNTKVNVLVAYLKPTQDSVTIAALLGKLDYDKSKLKFIEVLGGRTQRDTVNSETGVFSSAWYQGDYSYQKDETVLLLFFDRLVKQRQYRIELVELDLYSGETE